MENEIITIIQNIGWAGGCTLTAYLLITKVLSPLVNFFINKKNGSGKNLEGRIDKIENNDFHEMNRRLEVLENNDIRMWQSIDNIKDEISKVRERLSSLEAKIK